MRISRSSPRRLRARVLLAGACALLLALAPALLTGAPPAGADDPRDPGLRAHPAGMASPGLHHPRDGAVLRAGLDRIAAREPDRLVKVWVVFTDKGIRTEGSYREALAAFAQGLGERTRKRREAMDPGLALDFTDLPVYAPYVGRLRDAGFTVRRVSRWLNAASVEGPAGALPALEDLGFVRSVRPLLVGKRRPVPEPAAMPVGVQHAAASPTDSLEAWFFGPSYNQLDEIEGLALHRLGYTGAGVRVMVLDTGFRKDHPAVAGLNLVAEWDFVNEDGNTQNEGGDYSTQHNHGTGCWSVLGGYAPGALVGPAFAAEFVLAKTEDVTSETQAEEDNYVAALEWGDTLGVGVASASLAYWTFDDSTGYDLSDLDGDTAPITIAVDLAAAKGMCVVNANGNEGPGPSTLGSPADADTVIAVGAVDSLGTLVAFSSRGPTGDGRIKPEICARGLYTYWARAWTLGYGPASGTSLATPLIGGLVALLKEAQPSWTGYDIREAVIGTGTRSASPDNDYGYGIARGMAALTHGGATPSPPRMTLPFGLIEPADGATVNTTVPWCVWSVSDDAVPQDSVVYRAYGDTDPAFPNPVLLYEGPDTTFQYGWLPPGVTVWWRVEATGVQGYTRHAMNVHHFTVSAALSAGPGEPGPAPPAVLGAAFPNPTRAGTRIDYRLPAGETGALEVISVSGRLVRRFVLAGAGVEAAVAWDGRDASGHEAPAGVYFYRLAWRDGAITRKLVRLP